MEKFELQKPTSQPLALKSLWTFFQIGWSEQLEKSRNFSKIIYICDFITSELYFHVRYSKSNGGLVQLFKADQQLTSMGFSSSLFPCNLRPHRDLVSEHCRSDHWCHARRLRRLTPPSTISTLPPCWRLGQRIMGKMPGQRWIRYLSTRSRPWERHG